MASGFSHSAIRGEQVPEILKVEAQDDKQRLKRDVESRCGIKKNSKSHGYFMACYFMVCYFIVCVQL